MKIAIENQKFINQFLQNFNAEMKQHFKVFSLKVLESDINQFILNKIDHSCECDCKYQLQISNHKNTNEKSILQGQIQRLHKQISIQRERTANFVKEFTKRQALQYFGINNSKIEKNSFQNIKKVNKNKMNFHETVFVNYSPNKSNSLNSSIQMIKSNITDQTTCSPQPKKNKQTKSLQSSQIKTSTFKIHPLQISSEKSQQKAENKQRAVSHGKLFDKLRKLQTLMFQDMKQNKKIAQQSVWNAGISPEKQIIKEQNKNLKCIQQNLVAHLQILQRFRLTPDAERLIQREEKLKIKQKQLRILQDDLIFREIQINKKHSEILKNQRASIFLY